MARRNKDDEFKLPDGADGVVDVIENTAYTLHPEVKNDHNAGVLLMVNELLDRCTMDFVGNSHQSRSATLAEASQVLVQEAIRSSRALMRHEQEQVAERKTKREATKAAAAKRK